MIRLKQVQYELLFSNRLPPLWALYYCDELFFDEFERLCGRRYRILSVIRSGWQNKYGRESDLQKLRGTFQEKLKDFEWPAGIVNEFRKKSIILKRYLENIPSSVHQKSNLQLASILHDVRNISITLDTISNMLYLFSVLVGEGFMTRLANYSHNPNILNMNFIFYTDPLKQNHARIKVRKRQRLKLSPLDMNFSAILTVGAYIKNEVSTLLDTRKRRLNLVIKEIARRLQISQTDIEYLQINEISDALLSNVSVREKIVQRKKLTVLFYANKKLLVYEGKKAASFLTAGKYNEIRENLSISQLEGQTASFGSAVGKAVVAQTSMDAMRKMKKGCILIAPYTAVEYLPAMRLASAIITDTGGITCHAAIVSRELGIPCIIGTKVATKVLHDGDIVEVDADKGIVRKVS